jgi:hypothetical protein
MTESGHPCTLLGVGSCTVIVLLHSVTTLLQRAHAFAPKLGSSAQCRR